MRINGAETANGKSEAQRLIAHRAIKLLQRGAVIRCDVGNAQIDYTRNPCTHHADRTSLRQTECRMQHAVLRLFYAIAPSAHSENVRGLRSHCSDGQ